VGGMVYVNTGYTNAMAGNELLGFSAASTKIGSAGLLLNLFQDRREPYIPKAHLHAKRGIMRKAIGSTGINSKPELSGWNAALACRTDQQADRVVAFFNPYSIEPVVLCFVRHVICTLSDSLML
jgi:hypothetical protein